VAVFRDRRGSRRLRTPKLRGPPVWWASSSLKARARTQRSWEQESPSRGGTARCPRWTESEFARAASAGIRHTGDRRVGRASLLRAVAPGRGGAAERLRSFAPRARAFGSGARVGVWIWRQGRSSLASSGRAPKEGRWRVRGSEAKYWVSEGANESEQRPLGRGNSVGCERTREGNKASRWADTEGFGAGARL